AVGRAQAPHRCARRGTASTRRQRERDAGGKAAWQADAHATIQVSRGGRGRQVAPQILFSPLGRARRYAPAPRARASTAPLVAILFAVLVAAASINRARSMDAAPTIEPAGGAQSRGSPQNPSSLRRSPFPPSE